LGGIGVIREVELQARGLEDVKSYELFCRGMGGHWSVQHQKFFRFLEKKVQKMPEGNWVQVEAGEEFYEQCKAYNHDLISRIIFLSKLEEATRIRALVDMDGQTSTAHLIVGVARAFDRWMANIIA